MVYPSLLMIQQQNGAQEANAISKQIHLALDILRKRPQHLHRAAGERFRLYLNHTKKFCW